MVKQADVCWLATEITQQKLTAKVVSVRTLRDGLHECGVWWRKLREKPILTDDDVKERNAWAQKYRNKTLARWQANPKYMAIP